MEITVVCYGALRDSIGGERETVVPLQPGDGVDALIAALGIEERSVFHVLVNEDRASRSQELQEGDTVTLMPPFTGG